MPVTKRDRIPLHGFDVGRELAHALAAQVGAGVGRGLMHCPVDRGVVYKPAHPAGAYQVMVQTLVRINIVIFQVQRLQPGIFPVKVLGVDKRLQQLLFGDPINTISGG